MGNLVVRNAYQEGVISNKPQWWLIAMICGLVGLGAAFLFDLLESIQEISILDTVIEKTAAFSTGVIVTVITFHFLQMY
jgi:hypothetical protein